MNKVTSRFIFIGVYYCHATKIGKSFLSCLFFPLFANRKNPIKKGNLHKKDSLPPVL
ncbi:hypothetical protein HMPREF9446_00005 [Bacteroides fluxus YIT 12057]|uniref:Uncharacterized protein n=1 Tax=Bacteroides fluxus YIT 12057 TaxID=763034 RepID=F3PMS1_9BACE|nr:hypothetical protein HMPREF9446_00005 [Bacteroides fluxus YIT 12057]